MTEDSLKPTCPACGAEVAPDARFCSTCGAAIPETRTCPNCGAALAEDARICLECGTDVVSPPPPPVAAYVAPAESGSYARARPREESRSDTTLIVIFILAAVLMICCCGLFVFLRSGIVQAFMEGFRQSLRFGCLPLHLA